MSGVDEAVAIVGGGAAGLATAAACQRRGIHALVLERERDLAMPWARRYDSLRLNTPRFTSSLPGYQMPRRYGRWPTRDDLVDYLREYPRRLGLRVTRGVDVRRIDRSETRNGAGAWSLETSSGKLTASCVVVATGPDTEPKLPQVPGIDSFAGELLHAADYREPTPFRGRDVLVVGTNNTGSEIAFELARGGAARVRSSLRATPPVFPREWLGLPLNYTAQTLEPFPDVIGDVVGRISQRRIYGDLAQFGIGAATHGVQTNARRRHVSPIIDAGYIEALRAGELEVVPAVEAFDGEDVALADGSRIRPEVVIAATGYRRALEPLVGHLGVLDEVGHPPRAIDLPATRGLFFNGYYASMAGQLGHMGRDAKRIARIIARRLPV